jgi:hypothetical protein
MGSAAERVQDFLPKLETVSATSPGTSHAVHIIRKVVVAIGRSRAGRGWRMPSYVSLWLLALAFGWVEASLVLYLREIYLVQSSQAAMTSQAGLQVTLVSIPSRYVRLEIVREAWTLVLLAAAGWLAGRRLADRLGAFLLLFGIWDLTYYAVLWLVSGWPESLRAWDILFLIPLPWVAPVWAPATVAAIFIAAGSYLFWTPDRPREYGHADIAILSSAACAVVAAFLVEWRAAAEQRIPEAFPTWLFWAGVSLGTTWFIRRESAASGD